jgi:hypothetical protein
VAPPRPAIVASVGVWTYRAVASVIRSAAGLVAYDARLERQALGAARRAGESRRAAGSRPAVRPDVESLLAIARRTAVTARKAAPARRTCARSWRPWFRGSRTPAPCSSRRLDRGPHRRRGGQGSGLS